MTCATVEERVFTVTRPIDELIDGHEVPWLDLLAERTDGAEADDVLRAELLQAPDVRTERDPRRRDPVAASMARQKDEAHAVQHARHEAVARRAEGRGEGDLAHVLEPFDGVEAGAADDAHGREIHPPILMRRSRGPRR